MYMKDSGNSYFTECIFMMAVEGCARRWNGFVDVAFVIFDERRINGCPTSKTIMDLVICRNEVSL